MRQDHPEPLLTTAVAAAVRYPVSHDDFDPKTALTDVLADIGMDVAETGGAVKFVGADPVVPSRLRLGTGAAVTLAAKSAAVAKLRRLRGRGGQDISVDMPATDDEGFGLRFYPTADACLTVNQR